MAQILLLKVGTDGVPVEMSSSSDDITLNSYTIQGGGPVLSGTGLDLNNQDIVDISDVTFNDSSTATIAINSTTYIADNWMFETKENTMTTAGAVLFPVITDDADQVDAFRLPAIAGAPSATPSDGGEGYVVWDSTNDKMYAWTGSAWDDLSSVQSSNYVDDTYTTGEDIDVTEAVYLSAADTVSLADNDAAGAAALLGFATESILSGNSIIIRKYGVLGGFTGLTAGSRYFLDSTAGAITASVPASGTGAWIVQAGYAKSTTALDIQIQQLGRRA